MVGTNGLVELNWKIRPITRADADAIATWRYEERYALYDASSDDIGLLLDPANGYFAVVDAEGVLVACACFGPDARVPGGDYSGPALGPAVGEVVDVGIGMRPDLTGQGRGAAFVQLVLDEAVERFGDVTLRATIASFNERSMQVFRKLGFQETAMFRNPAGREFVILVRAPGAVG